MKNWRLRSSDGTLLADINVPVFAGSAGLIIGAVAFGLIYLDTLRTSIDAAQAWIATYTGWFFVLTVNVILAYLLYLLVARPARTRLGGQDAEPEFSRRSWLAMLFSAGMGIGLMFYGVAEPLFHLTDPPRGSPGSYEDAIAWTYLHWGLHAWGIYALTGLALAYFAFNRGYPLSIRSVFSPLLGERIRGWPGHLIDIIASVATLFGVATSLGLGAQQINAGLNQLFGTPVGGPTQILLIGLITAVATVSVVLGVERGIKRLSVFNIGIALLLMLAVLFIGPTLFILNGFVENIGIYLSRLPAAAFWNETYTGRNWQDGWTVFYWGWWIAWAPFVGMFIARISVGRSIREYIGGALLAATGMTFAWLAVFGGSALYLELNGPGGLADAATRDVARSLFIFLEMLPETSDIALPGWIGGTLGAVATLAIATFFVTSSDSGSLVIDIITAGGEPNPPTAQRVFWAVLEGIVAATLLVGGGLVALQTAAISAGLPFAFLLLLMVVAVHRALQQDVTKPSTVPR